MITEEEYEALVNEQERNNVCKIFLFNILIIERCLLLPSSPVYVFFGVDLVYRFFRLLFVVLIYVHL